MQATIANSAPTTPAGVPGEVLVQVEKLVRKFGSFTAVDDVSFEVRQGEIFGFLGPNGAGKSTTIKMICTLLRPTSGHIAVAGHDVQAEPDAVRSEIGIVFQDNSLDAGLTAQENLDFHCMMYHIPRAERADRMRDVLALMELTNFKDRIVKTYSGGMRRRLEIARGLLHRPRLLILDEPTVGLDPQTRNYIWQYVRQLREQFGTTIFMTTHYMDEAENCDRIAIIDRGSIIALDTPAGLKHMSGEDLIELETTAPEQAAQIIQQTVGVIATVTGSRLALAVPDAEHATPLILSALMQAGLTVQALQIRQASLEDSFIKLTGRKIHEEEGDKDQRRLAMRERGRL